MRAARVCTILGIIGSPHDPLLIAHGHPALSLALPIRTQITIVSIRYTCECIRLCILKYGVGMISPATVQSAPPAQEGHNS